jgi:hypothetical protein
LRRRLAREIAGQPARTMPSDTACAVASTIMFRCRTERKASCRLCRAVKHGRRALDALDELKLALLSGTLETSALLRLKTVATDLKEGSGDEKLDQVLGEIELRVAVELAKAGINSV